MPEDGRLEDQLRAASEALPDAPVRWNRVARKSRWRRRAIILALALAGFVVTIVLTTSALVGKTALDPSFTPPVFSGGGSSVEFHNPGRGRGLVPRFKYASQAPSLLGSIDQTGGGSLGYVFVVTAKVHEREGESLEPRWRIRRRGSGEVLSLPVSPGVEKFTPASADDSMAFHAWIGSPKEAGEYVVDFSLWSHGGVIVSKATSSPFHVISGDYFVPYRTPTYAATLPRNWKVVADYKSVPGKRFVTEANGPDGMHLLIDTTPNSRGDPKRSAMQVERETSPGEGYKRLIFEYKNLGGRTFEWSFELASSFSTDIFFYRGDDGFAVLTKSPPERFREARRVAREVARTLKGR